MPWILLIILSLACTCSPAFSAEIEYIHNKSILPELESKYIFIHGNFVSGDAQKFASVIVGNKINVNDRVDIYLSSDGGSVIEALEIGNIISIFNFSTNIGEKNNDDFDIAPGRCLSACIFSYIGGRYRFLKSGSIIGVHQFSFRDTTQGNDVIAGASQIVSAKISEFISRNNVDQKLLSIISTATPDDMIILSKDILDMYNVTNNGIAKEDWSFDVTKGIPLLIIQHEAYAGNGKIILYCEDRRAIGVMFITPGPDHGIGEYPRTSGLFIDSEVYKFNENEILSAPKIVEKYGVATFLISKELIQNILNSKSIGVAIFRLNEEFYSGFNVSISDKNRLKLHQIFYSCSSLSEKLPRPIRKPRLPPDHP